MPKRPLNIALEAIRTDGWFERVGERIGSFQALCEILGERFFAFSLITGARVTALTVDRRNLDESLVDFEVGGLEDGEPAERQRLTLRRFRERLVSALVAEESHAPAPQRDTDIEAIQMHIGVRYLLLAPLFGYSLLRLSCEAKDSFIEVNHDGVAERHELGAFRSALRALVLEELERSQDSPRSGRGGIDLAVLPEARRAFEAEQHHRVIELLGSWAMPLQFLLRTPDGQALGEDVRTTLAEALLLLGRSLAKVGEPDEAHDVVRLSVQYALDTALAGRMFAALGQFLLELQRPGQAIAPLRRAASLGAEAAVVWPLLSLAFLQRDRLLAAFGALRAARAAGVEDARLAEVEREVRERLPALEQWERWVSESSVKPAAPGA